MTNPPGAPGSVEAKVQFRRTIVRVMSMQLFALLLLGLLQMRYGS